MGRPPWRKGSIDRGGGKSFAVEPEAESTVIRVCVQISMLTMTPSGLADSSL